MRRPTDASIDPVTAARGLLIGLLALGIGSLPNVQANDALSPATLIGIGIALQLAIVAARTLARRHEREHGIGNALVPVVMQVGTLIADGVTVLLCAVAVFHARLAPLQAI